MDSKRIICVEYTEMMGIFKGGSELPPSPMNSFLFENPKNVTIINGNLRKSGKISSGYVHDWICLDVFLLMDGIKDRCLYFGGAQGCSG